MTERRGAKAWRDLTLLAERVVWRGSDRTLFVADLHLGKTASFRAGGSPAPTGVSDATLSRLGAVIDETGAKRLVALGDFLHSRTSMTDRLFASLCSWRAARPSLECIIVRGNHDLHSGDPDERCGFECVDEPHDCGGLEGRHHPLSEGDALKEGPVVLAGHLHPAAILYGPGRDRLKLPCFAVCGRQIILPAFGEFTGGASLAVGPDRWLAATTGADLFILRQSPSR